MVSMPTDGWVRTGAHRRGRRCRWGNLNNLDIERLRIARRGCPRWHRAARLPHHVDRLHGLHRHRGRPGRRARRGCGHRGRRSHLGGLGRRFHCRPGQFRDILEPLAGVVALGFGGVLVLQHVVERRPRGREVLAGDGVVGAIEIEFGLFHHGDGHPRAIHVGIAQRPVLFIQIIGANLEQLLLRRGVLALIEQLDGANQSVLVRVGENTKRAKNQHDARARHAKQAGDGGLNSHG
jgi:hypothetical protein